MNEPTEPRSGSFVAQIGEAALDVSDLASGLWVTFMSAWKSSLAPGIGAAQVCRAIAMRQIFYTSVQALGLTSVIGLLIGTTMIVQTELLGGAPHRETAGRILVAVVLRELAPLVTAIVVAGRSGTAIATELGVMRVNSEVLALASLGIDPSRFLVWPRMLATLVSVPVLTVYFSAMTILGGLLGAFFMDPHGIADWQTGIALGLTPLDLPLFLVKSLGQGMLVGWLCAYYGLDVGVSPTEVPQKASRAVVQTLLSCIVFNATVTVLFYWAFGVHFT